MKNENYEALQNAWRTAYLIAGFIKKTLTIEEEEELDLWIEGSRENMRLFEELTEEKAMSDYIRWYDQQDVEAKLQETRMKLGLPARARVVSFWRWAAAAAILLLICGSLAYLFVFKKKESSMAVHEGKHDILPGKAYAQLKLSTGKVIILQSTTDTVVNGAISIKNGTVMNNASTDNTWNEIVIPRKAYYKVILPDGSKVWLNSESSIRYPSSFDSIRTVTVTGETFFEVAKDPNHPFIVSAGGINVQALGTKFNINAYANEAGTSTTLVEGSVKVSDVNHVKILKPAEQITDHDWTIKSIETAPVTGWFKNEFVFKATPMPVIARMMERWYDVHVAFKDSIPYHFNGTISRDLPISQLLAWLEETGNVKFEMNKNEITVLK
ncbi:MAG: FecR family protein [Bacteroidota bacterium]|nr:FecR family protein [Bacteroidota bacterium]